MATTILINRGISIASSPPPSSSFVSVSKNTRELEKNLSYSLVTALGFGFLLGIIQYAFATPVITMLAGSSTEIIPLAVKYARIRSIGALFSIPTIVAQSAFLALKDASVPLQAALFGALFNLLGDIILVSFFNQGIGGAAIATFLSQLAGFLYLIVVGLQRIAKYKKVSMFDFAYFRAMVQVPSLRDVLHFLTFCGPLFFVLLVKTIVSNLFIPLLYY